MDGTKSKWASKGVWGGVIALLAAGANAFLQINVDAATQAEVTGHAVEIADAASTGDWARLMTAGVAAVSAGFAIYGRITATRKLA